MKNKKLEKGGVKNNIILVKIEALAEREKTEKRRKTKIIKAIRIRMMAIFWGAVKSLIKKNL